MRTATIDICGREYLLCFSARVVRAVTERYGGMEHIDEALSTEDPVKALDESVWLLAAMMDGGARYAMDLNDFVQIRTMIAETMTNGTTRHVEADPGKNAETTPAAP